MQQAHIAQRIFTGTEWLEDHVIITKDKIIQDIVPYDSLEGGLYETISYRGGLVPGFVDLQIYGAGGKLFSQHLSIESLEILAAQNLASGTLYCLPTIATNSSGVILKAIDCVREYIASGRQGIGGLHLEGPWINKIKKGAHLEEFIIAPDSKVVSDILDCGKGLIKMITVAPEVLSEEVLKILADSGVLISLGHSNATYTEAMNSFSKGVKTVTHLFNAMTPLHHREPGIPAAVFNHPTVCASIIPDGIHVDYDIVRLAHKVMKNRLFVITDAVTDTSNGPYQHKKEGNKYVANGVLSGSAITMSEAVHNLVNHAGIPLDEALKMCSLYPARQLGIDDQFGKIYKGGPANFVEFKNVE